MKILKRLDMRFIKSSLATVGAIGLAASCSAEAADKAESQQLVPAETLHQVTQAECLAMQIQSELIACFETLGKQNDRETTEREARIAALKADNAALNNQEIQLDTDNAALDDEIDQGRTTVKGLTRVLALQEEKKQD